MKSFIKNTTSSCLGSLIAFGIVSLFFFIVISSYTAKNKPNQKGILHIPLQGSIQDYGSAQMNFESLDFSPASLSTWDLIRKIDKAASDPNIYGIYLDVKSVRISQESAIEISEVLQDFKSSGKKIYAYSYYYNQNPYLLSSVADSVFLNPNGGVDLIGYGLYAPLFKSLLDRLGVDVNVYYAGKYKAGTEPYRLDAFTKDNKFQYKTYFSQLRDRLCKIIATNRNLKIEEIDTIIRTSKGYQSKRVLSEGLVDRLVYDDEFKDVLERDFENSDLVPISTYKLKEGKSKKVSTALVFAEGEIAWGEANMGGITYKSVLSSFEKIAEDENIETVILRINSPGGSGYTSDLIHREVSLLKAKGKKVVASLGPYAASGAYYIASACDSIYAGESSLTGSIGVYILFPTIDNFLKEKIGVSVDSISTDPNLFRFNPLLPVSEEQSKNLVENTENLYEQFLTRVAEGRGISQDSAHIIAQGRVWSGKDAVQVGLVDRNLSLQGLIQKYAQGMEDIKVYPKKETGLFEQLLNQSLGQVKIHDKMSISEFEMKLTEVQKLMSNPRPILKLPNDFFVMNQ